MGSEKPSCVGWEVTGLCMGLPKKSMWGLNTCACVGTMGLKGQFRAINHAGEDLNVSANIGSLCKAWDAWNHLECWSDDMPDWCRKEWCYVDAEACDRKDIMKAQQLPGALYQNRPLMLSWETCG